MRFRHKLVWPTALLALLALSLPRTFDAQSTSQAVPEPPTRVVRNGGTKEPTVDFSATKSPQEVKQRTDSINQLLDKTEADLKSISGRTLTAAQQETISQIKMYTQQARAALADGDLERAQTLASKGSVLAADLAGKP